MKGNIQIFVKTAATGTLDLTERAESYRFGTLQPGGLWQAQVATLAPERDLWTLFDAEEQGTLEFWVHGEKVWSGDLSGLTLEENKLTISAEGPVMRLKDPEIWRAFADSEYTRWETLDTDKFDKDTNDRLYFASRANVDYGDGERCRITWPSSAGEAGGTVKQVSAHVELIAWGRAWTLGLKADGAEVWSQAVTGNPTGTANVHISAVGGRGVLADEYIEILNTGSLEKIITNFTVYSGTTLLYTVPTFTMPSGQTIKVWTKAGTNTDLELFMGLTAAAFAEESGLAILNNE